VNQSDSGAPCQERLRLINEWMAAVREHSSALTNVSLTAEHSSAGDRVEALAELERCRAVVEAAEEALTTHRAEHGC
jgi:hypothetical protein